MIGDDEDPLPEVPAGSVALLTVIVLAEIAFDVNAISITEAAASMVSTTRNTDGAWPLEALMVQSIANDSAREIALPMRPGISTY